MGAHKRCFRRAVFLILSWHLFFALIIICSVGYDSPKLAGVIEGYAAEGAGIKAGDEIVKLNNTNIHFYREISLYSMLHEGETVDVTYLRMAKSTPPH